ncbi:MAG: hypothetical protein LQ342_000464 [Letrouitia transgressa]|nr:MAG: hypothetical protein LQ342_000464 [Letrouitia transgressa]
MPTKSKPHLGESWVVDGGSNSSGDSESEYTTIEATRSGIQKFPDAVQRLQRRSPRKSPKPVAEPEFIMPSIHEGRIGYDKARRRDETRLRRSIAKTGAGGGTSRSKDNLRNSRSTESTFFQGQNPVFPVFDWLYDVLSGAMRALKTPISYIIAVYLLVGLLLLLRNLLTMSFYSALSPICRIPGSSYMGFPMCRPMPSPQNGHHDEDQAASPVEFDRLMNVQNKFDAILEETAGGASLPLDMKRSETSIRDLRTVIRYSGLRSKNELLFELNGFIETAALASNDLSKFNSHVGRGVDRILVMARWTKRVLDGIAAQDGSKGSVATFFSDKLLAPFQPLKFTEQAVLRQYTEHTRTVENEINALIVEAQALLSILNNIEARLEVIHDVAVADDVKVRGSKQEIMSHLWTMLGGNRKVIDKYESQLRLLAQVNEYRQTAIAHVTGTILRLQAMGAELQDLRERAGGVELVPLRVHIENIELGVERLEERRNWARRLENDQMRKVLSQDPAVPGKSGQKEIGGGKE